MATLGELIAGKDRRIFGQREQSEFDEGMLDRITKKWQDHEERQAKQDKEDQSKYMTLRKAGYNKDSAFKAIKQGTAMRDLGLPETDITDIDREKKLLGIKEKKLDISKKEAFEAEGFEKGKTVHQKEQSAFQKTKALAVLKRGFGYDDDGNKIDFADRDQARAYIIKNFKVNLNDTEIRNKLSLYKAGGPTIKKPGFFGKIKGEKPQKKKFGHTYEKRDDGLWHLID